MNRRSFIGTICSLIPASWLGCRTELAYDETKIATIPLSKETKKLAEQDFYTVATIAGPCGEDLEKGDAVYSNENKKFVCCTGDQEVFGTCYSASKKGEWVLIRIGNNNV